MAASRRSILTMIGLAPIAAPVAAKEAAGRMGLSSICEVQNTDLLGHGLIGPTPGPDNAWARNGLLKLLGRDPYKMQEIERAARREARSLDPDIAALRSMSPSVAYSIQRKRCEERIFSAEKSWLEQACGPVFTNVLPK